MENRRNNLYFLILIAWIFPFIGCSSDKIEIKSEWTDTTIVIDGKPEEWESSTMNYFKESGASLGIKNDTGNLYFLLRMRDEASVAFLQSKVTLWLDKTGKKKKVFGINYTGTMPSGHRFGQGNNVPENMIDSPSEKFVQRQAEMQEIIVFKKEGSVLKSISIPANGKQGPAVARTYEKGFFCHEIRIPLQKSDSIPYDIDTKLGDTISVGLELGMDTDSHRGMPSGGMDGGPPIGGMDGGPPIGGMGGGPPGGGMGGGPPGGGMGGGPRGNTEQMPKKEEIWLKIILASEPIN